MLCVLELSQAHITVVQVMRRWAGNRNKDDVTMISEHLQTQIVAKSELMCKFVTK